MTSIQSTLSGNYIKCNFLSINFLQSYRNITKVYYTKGFPGGSVVKNPLFLGREYPLEKEMVTYSSILAWRIPWTAEPGGLQSMGLQRVGHNWATKQQQYYSVAEEKN